MLALLDLRTCLGMGRFLRALLFVYCTTVDTKFPTIDSIRARVLSHDVIETEPKSVTSVASSHPRRLAAA